MSTLAKDDTKPELPTPDLLSDQFLKEYFPLSVLAGVSGVISVSLSSLQTRGLYGVRSDRSSEPKNTELATRISHPANRLLEKLPEIASRMQIC